LGRSTTLLFFFILICIIIICFYIFFRYRGEKKPPDLNIRSSIDTSNTTETNGKSPDQSEHILSTPDQLPIKSNRRILYKFQDD
jgi:hypothetical protein